MKTYISIFSAFLFLHSTLYAQELNGPTSWETIGNTFSQPNVHLQLGRNFYDWYGSGDVNNDEVIDNNDLIAINNSVKNYRSNLDLKGEASTIEDKQILQEYLSGLRNYLPGHFNSLNTYEEKVYWWENVVKKMDIRKHAGPGWECRNYVIQGEIDTYGLSNIDQFIQEQKASGEITYDKTDNALYNGPMQGFSTYSNGVPHAVMGLLVGKPGENPNPLEFDHWYFVGSDFSDYRRIYPGDLSMDGDQYAKMSKVAYIEPDYAPGTYFFDAVSNFLNFDIKNNIGSLKDYAKDWLLLEDPSNFTIDVVDPIDKTLNYQVNLNTTPNVTGYPEVNVSNGLEAILTYSDGSNVPTNTNYPNIEYYFDRTWTGEATSSSLVTKRDSEVQRIYVKDNESPTGNVPIDINLTNEQVVSNGGLSTSITGEITNVKDNSNLPVNINVAYQLKSATEEEKIYNSIFTLTDVFGNVKTYSSQKITVLYSQISIQSLTDLLINAEKNQDLSPQGLKEKGYNSEPKVTISNSTSDYTLTYFDKDTIYHSSLFPWADREFTRLFIAKLNSDGIADTMQHKIIVKDLENPFVENLEAITITDKDSLHPSVTGYPKITDNVAVGDTAISYNLISENSTEKNFKAQAKVADVFGNDTTFLYQDVKVYIVTDINNKETLPLEFALFQNYPNPFNPTTKISYSIPSNANFQSANTNVSLTVYDILGNKIEALINEAQKSGYYAIQFKAEKLSSGIYYYQLITDNYNSVKKMLIFK
ncbi:MAG: T9SS type A sorting domain-containing protein [Ignavibacteriae bacterium]|nr:T9SS type A sorting domain-containing protein [Ignavibacteriota bacterium]